jgi:hypothetical protein
MSTFAETAIVDYRRSLANQEKRTSVSFSGLQQTNESFPMPFLFVAKKRKLQFSVSSVLRLQNSRNMETWRWRHGKMET